MVTAVGGGARRCWAPLSAAPTQLRAEWLTRVRASGTVVLSNRHVVWGHLGSSPWGPSLTIRRPPV